MKSLMSVLSKLAAAAALSAASSAHGAEIKLIAAAEMRHILLFDLLPSFEKSSGHKVKVVWEVQTTTKPVVEREAADAVLIPAPDLDTLVAADVMLKDSRVHVAKVGLGVVIPEGRPKPDISSAEAVKKAVLSARSIAYSSGPSGLHLAELFKKMGIADKVKDKIERKNFHQWVADLVTVGRVDLGFDLESEFVPDKGAVRVQYVGPLPPDIQYITVFAAALRKSAAPPEAAKALMKFLTAPEAAAAIKKHGMEPG